MKNIKIKIIKPFSTGSKTIKHLEINLMKHIKFIPERIKKLLRREIKDSLKNEKIPFLPRLENKILLRWSYSPNCSTDSTYSIKSQLDVF